MRFRAQTAFILFAFITATITEAQNTPQQQLSNQRLQIPGNMPAAKPPAGITQQAAALAPAVPAPALSMLDQPARPAQVQMIAGKLSVKADNSTLSDILHNISTKTGMTVDGLSRDQRIFGSYGPAAPREVLSALLDGIGYNVMMVGALDNGAPRQLTLTPRKAGGAEANNRPMQAMRQNNTSSNDDEEDDPQSGDQQDNTPQPPRPEPGPQETNQPGEQQQQAPANPGQPGQVKTPQQMLQELQQMRQQQLQQIQQTNPQ